MNKSDCRRNGPDSALHRNDGLLEVQFGKRAHSLVFFGFLLDVADFLCDGLKGFLVI